MKFSELMESEKPVLIDFYATWCGPCKAMTPILDDVKARLDGNAYIYKVDVDKHPKLAAQFQVKSIPTLIAFDKGQIVWKKVGMAGAAELVGVLQNISSIQNK